MKKTHSRSGAALRSQTWTLSFKHLSDGEELLAYLEALENRGDDPEPLCQRPDEDERVTAARLNSARHQYAAHERVRSAGPHAEQPETCRNSLCYFDIIEQ